MFSVFDIVIGFSIEQKPDELEICKLKRCDKGHYLYFDNIAFQRS